MVTDKGLAVANVLVEANYKIGPKNLVTSLFALYGPSIEPNEMVMLCSIIDKLQSDGMEALLDMMEDDDDQG